MLHDNKKKKQTKYALARHDEGGRKSMNEWKTMLCSVTFKGPKLFILNIIPSYSVFNRGREDDVEVRKRKIAAFFTRENRGQ